jgi:hypothetical protein
MRVIYAAAGLRHNNCAIHEYDVTEPAGPRERMSVFIALFRICAVAMFTVNTGREEDGRKTTHPVQT